MTTPASTDPYLWLEEVESGDALAWVRAQTATTADRLHDAAYRSDQDALYELATLPSNIPMITRRGGFVYNFWQDADHVRGIWRRTTLDSYRTDAPDWDVLLDVDALARDEDEDWVYKGSQSCEPSHERVLLTLSRGGADAAHIREYDLPTRSFVNGGFVVPESKSSASWEDADTLLVATTLGEGNATPSGYPRIVRRWTRGTDFDAAPVVFEGTMDDMAVYGFRDRSPGHERTIFGRQLTFEESQTYLGESAADAVRLDVPLDAALDLDRDWLTLRLKSEWAVGGATYPPDTYLVISAEAFLSGDRNFHVLFEPKPRRVLMDATWTKSRLVLTIMDNLVTEVLWATPRDGDWKLEPVAGFPSNATLMVGPLDGGVMSRTDDLLAVVTSFLEPTTMGLFSPDSDFTVVKTAPSAFDATDLTVSRHEAIAEDGERIPYFQIGRESDGPVPTVLYGYGGFNVPMMPSYLGGIGKVWLEPGNTWVIANLRGGGEFGAEWHKAGMREGKKTAHDDFAAVARDLLARGVTTTPQLACYGGSNGGLLV
ncbi:MAG: prolyl oligopeptidase family serine peptidase, partial [Mycobacteriales bacterium]